MIDECRERKPIERDCLEVLIETLIEKTKDGCIVWEETSNRDEYMALMQAIGVVLGYDKGFYLYVVDSEQLSGRRKPDGDDIDDLFSRLYWLVRDLILKKQDVFFINATKAAESL